MTSSSTDAADACEDICDVDLVHADAVESARSRIPPEARIQRGVDVASLLANPTRLRILIALAAQGVELCVCDLSAVVGATDTLTSHQLRSLRLAGLVEQRREGRLVHYRLAADPHAASFIAALTDRA